MRKRILILAMCLGLAVSSVSGCSSTGKNQEKIAGNVSQETASKANEPQKKDEWIENPMLRTEEEPAEENIEYNIDNAEIQMKINAMEACEPLNLTMEQKIEDFDFFWNEIQDKVFCLDEILSDRGINLEKYIADYRERIKNSKDDYEFYDILSKSALAVSGTWHIEMKSPYTALLQGFYYPWQIIIQDAVFANDNQKKLKYWDKMLSQKDNNYKWNKDMKAVEKGAPPMPELKIINDKIVVISVPSFSYPTNEGHVEDVLLNLLKEASDYEHVIFDLEGNRGGSPHFAVNTLIAPNIEQPLESSQFYFFKDTERLDGILLRSSEAEKREIYLGYLKQTDFPSRSLEEFPEKWKIDGGEYGNADSYTQLDMEVVPRFQKKILNGKIWVLTYPENYSASEYFVRMCKDTGFATLVGSKTRGDATLFPVWFTLPNSGLVCSSSATWALNEDGTCNSSVGTSPDIESPEGETPLETCLKAIAEESRK